MNTDVSSYETMKAETVSYTHLDVYKRQILKGNMKEEIRKK